VSVEGWTPEHDDEHAKGEMSLAAACYAIEGIAPYTGLGIDVKRTWQITGWDWSWWKPTSRRRNLVKAGALILAEIERIDRDAARDEPITAERIGGVHLSIATGIDLDAIGDFYKTPRNKGEPDADYRKRIQSIKEDFEAWVRDRESAKGSGDAE
jgi:hypothetical protein